MVSSLDVWRGTSCCLRKSGAILRRGYAMLTEIISNECKQWLRLVLRPFSAKLCLKIRFDPIFFTSGDCCTTGGRWGRSAASQTQRQFLNIYHRTRLFFIKTIFQTHWGSLCSAFVIFKSALYSSNRLFQIKLFLYLWISGSKNPVYFFYGGNGSTNQLN